MLYTYLCIYYWNVCYSDCVYYCEDMSNNEDFIENTNFSLIQYLIMYI